MSFWDTPAGILEQCGLLADEVQGRTYNNALKIFATNVGVTDFKVVGPLKNTSCEWCKMHANKTVYHRGMFLPNLPRHPNCPHILEPQRIGAVPENEFSAFWNLLS